MNQTIEYISKHVGFEIYENTILITRDNVIKLQYHFGIEYDFLHSFFNVERMFMVVHGNMFFITHITKGVQSRGLIQTTLLNKN